MKKSVRGIMALLMIVTLMVTVSVSVFAVGEGNPTAETATVEEAATDESGDSVLGDKAMAAAIAVGLAAAAGAVGMGWAIAKSVEGISRQPEAEGKIRTTLMLGLVFVETAIIYALVIAILIIFVL